MKHYSSSIRPSSFLKNKVISLKYPISFCITLSRVTGRAQHSRSHSKSHWIDRRQDGGIIWIHGRIWLFFLTKWSILSFMPLTIPNALALWSTSSTKTPRDLWNRLLHFPSELFCILSDPRFQERLSSLLFLNFI